MTLMLTGGGELERYTFAGACNEPVPNNWKNACRRRAGHHGEHHYWDPRTGTGKSRHPLPFRDNELPFVEVPTVYTWGKPGPFTVRMLHRSAYVAPASTDRLMVAAIKARENR